MSSGRKVCLIYAGRGSTPQCGEILDTQRLVKALRERGGEVVEMDLASGPREILDQLQDGAVPLVLHCDRST